MQRVYRQETGSGQLTYQDFLRELEDLLTKALGETYAVSTHSIRRNNQVYLDTLVIRREGEQAAPCIYLDQYYTAYKEGAGLSEIAESILKSYENTKNNAHVDMHFLGDWEQARKLVVCRLVGEEANRELLQDVPHCRFLDMAIVYYCQFDTDLQRQGEQCSAGLLVPETLMKCWGVSREELDRTARDNTAARYPSAFCTMREMMAQLLGEQFEEGDVPERGREELYVLSNSRKMYGAYWITDESILMRVYEKLQSDFYVLPSSVHECMIIPVWCMQDVAQLQRLVKEVNETQVAPEEVLTNSVYRFSGEKKQLLPA